MERLSFLVISHIHVYKHLDVQLICWHPCRALYLRITHTDKQTWKPGEFLWPNAPGGTDLIKTTKVGSGNLQASARQSF